MAVYDQAYRPYTGPTTSAWAQRFVIPRYALRQLFASRLFAILFVLCLIPPLGHAVFLYVVHNVDLFTKLGVRVEAGFEALRLGARQFEILLTIQSAFALVLMVIAGPTMIARDLHNNGLALYLSRPLSKWTYIGGKFAALAALLSAITWIPGLCLYAFNAALETDPWFLAHLRWAAAFFAGSWALIVLYSLVALAASTLLKWRPLAMAAIFGALVVGTPFGAAINVSLNTRFGSVFDLLQMLQVLWAALFGEALVPQHADFPPLLAAFSVAASCGVSLLILKAKVQPYEVVR